MANAFPKLMQSGSPGPRITSLPDLPHILLG